MDESQTSSPEIKSYGSTSCTCGRCAYGSFETYWQKRHIQEGKRPFEFKTHYGFFGGLLLSIGISARPVSVSVHCLSCGSELSETDDYEVRNALISQ